MLLASLLALATPLPAGGGALGGAFSVDSGACLVAVVTTDHCAAAESGELWVACDPVDGCVLDLAASASGSSRVPGPLSLQTVLLGSYTDAWGDRWQERSTLCSASSATSSVGCSGRFIMPWALAPGTCSEFVVETNVWHFVTLATAAAVQGYRLCVDDAMAPTLVASEAAPVSPFVTVPGLP